MNYKWMTVVLLKSKRVRLFVVVTTSHKRYVYRNRQTAEAT